MAEQKPEIKHKTFTYRNRVERVAERAGQLQSEGKDSFRVASPPEFKGEAGVWSPEDLFVGAVNTCTMTTFASFSLRKQLPVVSYSCEAEGILEFVDGGYRFTRVTLRPTVVVSKQEAVEETRKALEDAHHNCLVANSVKATVVVEPDIKVG